MSKSEPEPTFSLLASDVVDPVEDVLQAYLYRNRGDWEAALRMASADVVAANRTAAAVGAGASWGFLRRPRDSVFAPGES